MTDFGRPPQGAPANVVPYVEFHTGPRRVLTLNLTTGIPLLKRGTVPPIVSIDGRQYIVYWGVLSFEIPADRACHLSVHVEGDQVTQAASVLLPPGNMPLMLTYGTDFLNGIGTLR